MLVYFVNFFLTPTFIIEPLYVQGVINGYKVLSNRK